MSTLNDYAHRHYPRRPTDLWQGWDPPFRDHTVVVHVVGRETAERTIGLLQRAVPPDEVAAVLVRDADPPVPPTSQRVLDGVVDPADLRIAVAAVTGTAIGVVAARLLGTALGLTGGMVLALAVFLAAAGLALGGIAGSFAEGRRAASGSRARVPGTEVGLVAALVADLQSALALADDLGRAGLHDVRIVSCDGAWHVP